jgi:hypothetical protein
MKSILSCLAIAIVCSFSASAQPRPPLVYELACPSGYSPVSSFGKSFNSVTGQWRANVCIHDNGDGTMLCQMSGCGGGQQNPILINQTTDFFNRTGTLGSNWTAYLNSFSVSPGVTAGQTASLYNAAAYTGTTSNPTQTCRIVVAVLNGSTDYVGCALRISGTPATSVNFYACVENSTSLTIYKVTGASNGSDPSTVVMGGSGLVITGVPGDYLVFGVVGNTLTCERNNNLSLIQVNDASSPFTTGYPGIAQVGNVANIGPVTFTNAPMPSGGSVNMVFDGDSITSANGNGSPNTDPMVNFLYYPSTGAWATSLGVSSKCLGIVCNATTSGVIESMLTTGTTAVDPLYVPGVKNIVVIWGGTNDIANGQTPAQVLTNLTTYVAARHAVGWKVAVIQTLSRISTINPLVDRAISVYNAGVLSNTAGADLVIPMPPAVALPGSSANTILFNADQTHPTQLSHIDIFAKVISAYISRL